MSNNESTEQGRSGQRGAEAPREDGQGQQPRQGANRVEAQGENEPKHSFAPGQAPSEQGEEGSPSPESIKKNQQGLAGGGSGQSGSHPGGSDRSEARAQSGEPSSDHTRHGRQKTPGDRSTES